MRTSLLRYCFVHRFPARLLILFLGLVAALFGISSPFFQKIFVDRMLGAAVITKGAENLHWLETVEPLALIALAFFCAIIAQGLALLANYIGLREGVILQKEYAQRLYRKMLGLRTDALAGSTVGEVVSIYATDVPGSTAIIDQAIPAGASIFFPLVIGPLAVRWICGIPLWATLTVMSVILAMNIVLSTRQSRFFFRFKQLAAERTGIVNEWIQNIRLLRILGWIENYEGKIFRKREEETRNRVAMVTNGQLMGAFGTSISYVINLTGVASLVFLRADPVSPGELFALLWIFGVFLSRPFRQIPWIITFSLDSLSSMRRLESFLERESVGQRENSIDLNEAENISRPERGDASLPLEVRGLNLEIGGQRILRDVSFSVGAGEFIAIVGEVGSGKSSLVYSLVGENGARFDRLRIGETDALSLDLNSRRRHFAFVPQEGFVMSASLRENVMFQYGVASESDLVALGSLARAQFRLESEHVRDGLETEIGERGVNLSGGQRQRVSLARADYYDRPIVLLDDCLSAVDVDTENQLIRDLIDGAWKKRTRILVTHRLTVLSRVDRILFMEDGRVADTGTFGELMERSARMREFVASVRKQEESENLEKSGGRDVQAEVVS